MHPFQELTPILFFVALFAAVLIAIAAKTQGEARATERNLESARRLAGECGLALSARMPPEWLEGLPNCSVFRQAPFRAAAFWMAGNYREFNIQLFEISSWFTGRYNERTPPIIDLVLLISVKDRNVPSFELVPLSLSERIADSIFGGERIVFEGAQASDRFSAAYSLWADDRQAVESLFRPAVDFLAERPGWRLWSGEGQLVFWSPKWRTRFRSRTSEERRRFLDGALDFADLLLVR